MKGIRHSNVPFLNIAFPRKGHFKWQALSVHVGNKTFKCNVCDATFSQKFETKPCCISSWTNKQTNKHLNVTFVTMNVHIFKNDIVNIASVHEWPKPFLCDICGYTCSRKGDMNKHILSVHERTKSFRCDICGHTCSR